jgi:hypothetical protein
LFGAIEEDDLLKPLSDPSGHLSALLLVAPSATLQIAVRIAQGVRYGPPKLTFYRVDEAIFTAANQNVISWGPHRARNLRATLGCP